MHSYQVFGRVLHSELEFPELPPAQDHNPHWSLRVLPPLAGPPGECRLLGADEVDSGISVRLYTSPAGLWLQFDDTGCFEITPDGTEIRWYAPSVELAHLARLDILGRVLAIALHAQGMLCLHGSGVCIDGRAIGFLAPKFHGKSTTALALVGAGAKLITDDTLIVQPGNPAVAHPGVHVTRLWPDSARHLAVPPKGVGQEKSKQDIIDLPEERRMLGTAPLAALYLLSPVVAGPERTAAQRTLLDPMRAALALVAHGKLTAILGGTGAATNLERAVEVSRTVPVYRLDLIRDFDRLDQVIARIGAWHGEG